jgi:hypothetical protein
MRIVKDRYSSLLKFSSGYFHVPPIFTVTSQIEDLATKLDADKKESRRCLAELDNIKV